MDPERFQSLAGRLLHREGKDPAACRTAISRSYYAAFHVARHLLEPHFHFPADASAHVKVRRLLSYADHEDLRNVSTELDNLRAARNVADYDLSQSDVDARDNARHEVNVAAEQIRTLKLLAAGEQWGSIMAEIRRKDAAASSPR
jgi:uncharacterized protein (UPF0332 family)